MKKHCKYHKEIEKSFSRNILCQPVPKQSRNNQPRAGTDNGCKYRYGICPENHITLTHNIDICIHAEYFRNKIKAVIQRCFLFCQ